jgi:hypothetical protein
VPPNICFRCRLTAKEEKLGRFASESEEREPSPGDPASGCSEGVSPWDQGDPTIEASAPEDIFFFFNNDEAITKPDEQQQTIAKPDKAHICKTT